MFLFCSTIFIIYWGSIDTNMISVSEVIFAISVLARICARIEWIINRIPQLYCMTTKDNDVIQLLSHITVLSNTINILKPFVYNLSQSFF